MVILHVAYVDVVTLTTGASGR